MGSQDVVIVGVGMVTAVGLSAAETAASVSAGLMRFSETELMDGLSEPFTLAEVPDEGLPGLAAALEDAPLTSREARMLRLAAAPLAQALGPLPDGEPAPALSLALPELETTRPIDGGAFLAALAVHTGARFDAAQSDADSRGRAGGLIALERAAARIRTGAARFALAGAVDTYRDPYVLGRLDREQRVKSEVHLDGFIPGEGAAFLLLASGAAAGEAGLQPLASPSPVAEAFEPGHLYSEEPYRGDGLAAAVAALAAAGAARPILDVYSSMNGESHWAKEWGVAVVRNKDFFAEDVGMHHPADCYGDPGAAAAPLMVGLAGLGLKAGRHAGACLVYASSDSGPRAAVVLTPA